MGRGLRAGGPHPDRPRPSRPGRLLHVRANQQRGRVPLPAVRAGPGHQQPAGLLEHVPRVERRGVERDHRRGQGQRVARRHPPGRSHPGGGPEPGDQPSAHAHRPGAGQAQRSPHHRREPAPRGRPDGLRQPPAAPRPGRCGHPAGRSVPAGAPERGPGAVPGHQPAGGGSRRRAPRGHRPRLRGRPLRRPGRPGRAPRVHPVARAAGGHRPGAGPDRPGGRAGARIVAHHRVLGHGAHPARQRGGHHPRDRQPAPAPGQHRTSGCRCVPGSRALQRAGRPHHGHLGAAARLPARRPPRRVRLRPPAPGRPRCGGHHPGHGRRPDPGVHGPGRQLRVGHAPTPRSPPRRWPAAT